MRIIEKIAAHNRNLGNTPPVVMAFIGDSVTQGCFETNVDYNGNFTGPVDYKAVYHNILKSKLESIFPKGTISVINAGVGGDSAPGGLKRLERDVLRFSPDFVSVCYGLNDCGGGLSNIEKYTFALDSIFKALQQLNIDVLFLTPNCMNTYVDDLLTHEKLRKTAEFTAKNQNEGILFEYINQAKKICIKNNVQVCDVYDQWIKMQKAGVDTTALLANRINHPIREMHSLFAEKILDALFD